MRDPAVDRDSPRSIASNVACRRLAALRVSASEWVLRSAMEELRHALEKCADLFRAGVRSDVNLQIHMQLWHPRHSGSERSVLRSTGPPVATVLLSRTPVCRRLHGAGD